MKNRKIFAFAGLWDIWKGEDGQMIRSCTIITTTPNKVMEPIHHRMPVILSKENEKAWLDRRNDNPEYLKSFLQPYDTNQMEAYEVTKSVGNVKNQGEELIRPL